MSGEREQLELELDAAEGQLDDVDRTLILEAAASLSQLAEAVVALELPHGQADLGLEQEETLLRHPRRHITNTLEVVRRHV